MDHPAPSIQSVQPWRSAALVAAAVAAVELMLLVVAGVAIFMEPFADKVEHQAAVSVAEAKAEPASRPELATVKATTPGTKDQKAAPAAQLSRGETSVLVLNGNGSQGAAAAAGGVVRGLHYLLAGTANAPRTDFARSVVMFRPGFEGEARRLAKDVRVKQITPLDGLKPRELEGAHLVLIVGG